MKTDFCCVNFFRILARLLKIRILKSAETAVTGGITKLGDPVPGGYKYGDVTLRLGSLESEIVKCGHGSRGTWARE
jgi:hypothetical protein